MGSYLKLEREHMEFRAYTDKLEIETKQELQNEKRISIERLLEAESLRSKLQEANETKDLITKTQKDEISFLKESFNSLKRLF